MHISSKRTASRDKPNPHLATADHMHASQSCYWIVWLMIAGHFCANAAAETAQQGQQQQRYRQHWRPLLQVDTLLYCNATTDCKPCLPKHLDTEACRATAYAQHLSCSADKRTVFEVSVRVHHGVDARRSPLHISRSCSRQTNSSALAWALTEHNASAVGGQRVDPKESPHPGQFYFPQNADAYRTGGLNVLYFELAMLAVLGGSLPVMYIRKKRHVRFV